MEVVKELKENYLSKPHYNSGVMAALLFFFTCLLLSILHWNSLLDFKLLAKGKEVFEGHQYYLLLTSSYIHGDLRHLLANTPMLLILIYFSSQYYGALTMWTLSAVGGIFINAVTLSQMDPSTGLLGASGIVYFLWGFWLALYFKIENHISVNRRIMKIMAIGLFMLFPSSFDPMVSYAAHFNGLWMGILTGGAYYLFNRNKLISYQHYRYKLEEPALWYDEEVEYGEFYR